MKAYQLFVYLKDTRPEIWRTIVVPGGITFHRLHDVLQLVMEWWAVSPYSFSFGERRFILGGSDGQLPPEQAMHDGARRFSAYDTPIDSFLREGDIFTYRYDFTKCWDHEIEVQEILDDYEFSYPMIVAGDQPSPPEGCNDLAGYYRLLDILEDPAHPDYEGACVWISHEKYGPFDIDACNDMLRRFARVDSGR